MAHEPRVKDSHLKKGHDALRSARGNEAQMKKCRVVFPTSHKLTQKPFLSTASVNEVGEAEKVKPTLVAHKAATGCKDANQVDVCQLTMLEGT